MILRLKGGRVALTMQSREAGSRLSPVRDWDGYRIEIIGRS
jgi:hypothetical protein